MIAEVAKMALTNGSKLVVPKSLSMKLRILRLFKVTRMSIFAEITQL